MNVNCLLVSRDSEVQQVIADVFTGIDLRLREDALSALEIIGKSHFDGFVVDCDGVEKGPEVIAAIRSSRGNRKSVIFTIVNGKTSFATATELGSNFVLGSPIEPSRLQAYLRSAVHKMESEHRRYFRYQLSLEAVLITRDEKVIPAQILNVSDGGIALRLLDRAHLHGAVTIRFVIPGVQARVLVAKVAVCWATGPILGMQFVDINADSRSAYDDWLKCMALV
jgi:DNA-binding response OmpR family regulator